MDINNLHDIKREVLRVVSTSDRWLSTASLQMRVAIAFGIDLEHPKYGPTKEQKLFEGRVVRQAMRLAEDRLIVRDVRATGRGMQESAYYASLALVRAQRIEDTAEVERRSAVSKRRSAVRSHLEAAGFEVQPGLQLSLEDWERLIATYDIGTT